MPTGDSATLKPLLFFHAIKTGGTSFNNWLISLFPDPECRVDLVSTDERKVDQTIEALARLTPDDRARIKVIYGHSAHRALGIFPDSIKITLIRDPFSYVISRYVFNRQVNSTAENARVCEEMPANEQLFPGEAPYQQFLDNVLSWSIGPSIDTNVAHLHVFAHLVDSTISSSPNEIAVADVERILDTFDFVGITDQLDLFCFFLSRKLGLPFLPIRKDNAMNSGRIYFPLWFKEDILRRCPRDAAAYDLAVRRFDSHVERIFNEDPAAYLAFKEYRSQTSAGR